MAAELAQRVEEHNHKVFLYNTAVDLVRADRLEEARDLLKQVLEGRPEYELEQQALDLLSELRRHDRR